MAELDWVVEVKYLLCVPVGEEEESSCSCLRMSWDRRDTLASAVQCTGDGVTCLVVWGCREDDDLGVP